MRKVLWAIALGLSLSVLVGVTPAHAATADTQWVCDVQGPVTQHTVYDHYGPISTGWSLELSGKCTSPTGGRASFTSRSVYDAWMAPEPGLCDDIGVLPPFAANALMGSVLTGADGHVTSIFHNWGIAPPTTTAVGGPVSQVVVGGTTFPTGPDSPDLKGNGVAFTRIFGACPPPGSAPSTTNARFVLLLTETRVV